MITNDNFRNKLNANNDMKKIITSINKDIDNMNNSLYSNVLVAVNTAFNLYNSDINNAPTEFIFRNSITFHGHIQVLHCSKLDKLRVDIQDFLVTGLEDKSAKSTIKKVFQSVFRLFVALLHDFVPMDVSTTFKTDDIIKYQQLLSEKQQTNSDAAEAAGLDASIAAELAQNNPTDDNKFAAKETASIAATAAATSKSLPSIILKSNENGSDTTVVFMLNIIKSMKLADSFYHKFFEFDQRYQTWCTVVGYVPEVVHKAPISRTLFIDDQNSFTAEEIESNINAKIDVSKVDISNINIDASLDHKVTVSLLETLSYDQLYVLSLKYNHDNDLDGRYGLVMTAKDNDVRMEELRKFILTKLGKVFYDVPESTKSSRSSSSNTVDGPRITTTTLTYTPEIIIKKGKKRSRKKSTATATSFKKPRISASAASGKAALERHLQEDDNNNKSTKVENIDTIEKKVNNSDIDEATKALIIAILKGTPNSLLITAKKQAESKKEPFPFKEFTHNDIMVVVLGQESYPRTVAIFFNKPVKLAGTIFHDLKMELNNKEFNELIRSLEDYKHLIDTAITRPDENSSELVFCKYKNNEVFILLLSRGVVVMPIHSPSYHIYWPSNSNITISGNRSLRLVIKTTKKKEYVFTQIEMTCEDYLKNVYIKK